VFETSFTHLFSLLSFTSRNNMALCLRSITTEYTQVRIDFIINGYHCVIENVLYHIRYGEDYCFSSTKWPPD